MEQIRLDMIPKGIKPVCHASQYDVNRNIRLYLMDGMQGYTLTDETVEIHIRKPDNTVITAEVEYTTGTSYVDIITTQQMVAVSGKNLCELVIKKDTTVIGSLNFIMEVEHDPLDGGIESESEIHDLRSQVAADVALEVENQYDSNSVIFDDEATTGHNIGYVVSSEYIKELENNVSESFEGVAEELDTKANSNDLATVARTGNFNDLTNKPVVDTALSTSSTNAVQNKVVKSAIDAKANSADLSTVATSGNYNDLSNKPVIDSSLSASSTNAVQNKIVKTALDTKANTASLATVATSGNYNDLLNKPMTEQGTVNNINFSGLAHGLYRCYVPTNSTGTPASNVGGHCLTFINDSVNYGSQILFSNLGLYWRNRSGGSWGTWKTLITS